jgi:uncharacterized phiE125 gp8 family phage protein
MIIWSPKGPAAVEKFEFDFTDRLGTATIAGDATLSSAGVTIDSHQVNAQKVDLMLSGGTEGSVAKVGCTIVTSNGETLSEVGVLPIGGEAVSLAIAKAAQKIEDDDEDALLAGFLRAAVRTVEKETGRNLTQQVVTQTADGFPAGCDPRGGPKALRLWQGPVAEILEVKYDDPDGVEQTLTSFRLVEGASARLLPAYGASWPATAAGPGTVRLTYVAGHDPADRDLAGLTQIAILLFGHWNANREAVVAGAAAQSAELPLGVQMLLDDYRVPGIA